MATDPKSPGSVAKVFANDSPPLVRIPAISPPDQEAGEQDMSTSTVPDEQLPELPCHVSDPDLWFADSPSELERAKALCADCPIRRGVPGRGAGTRRTVGSVGRRDSRSWLRREPQTATRTSAQGLDRRVERRKVLEQWVFRRQPRRARRNREPAPRTASESARAHPADTGSPLTRRAPAWGSPAWAANPSVAPS